MPLAARVADHFHAEEVLEGLPGTSGFVGEFLTLAGAFKANTWVAAFATTGVILSAGYALWLYRKVVFGALEKENLETITDMNKREIAILAPLIVLTVFFGVYPAPIIDAMDASVTQLIDQYQASLAALESAGQVAQAQ